MTRLHSLSLLALLATACGPGIGNGPTGTSRLGESCATRNDCITGLTCRDQKCVTDETTTRTCAEIETAYVSSSDASANDSCVTSADCGSLSSLCNGTQPFDGMVNKAAVASFEPLQREWRANGCNQNTTCGEGLPPVPWCSGQRCRAFPGCSQVLEAICISADCGLYGSTNACLSALADAFDCTRASLDRNAVDAARDCIGDQRVPICDGTTKSNHATKVLASCARDLQFLRTR